MLARVANPVYSTLGIELVSWRLLIFLLERGEMRVGELVELSHTAQSTVSQQLKALDRLKLIKRARSAEDNRSVTVALTAKGRLAAKQCNKVSEGVYQRMLERLGPQDVDKLNELLEKAYETLVEYEASPRGTGS